MYSTRQYFFMIDDRRKIRRALLVLLMLQLPVWLSALTGCGGQEIPSAGVLTSGEVTLMWNDVPGAAAYHVYLSTTPGVTPLNSFKISDVSNPITISDLEPGTTYYFIVSVEDDSGQSRTSDEKSYTAAETQGSVQFGNILSTAAPAAAVSKSDRAAGTSQKSSETPQQGSPEPGTQQNTEIIICFGDSLTYGTGASTGMDYPSQLSQMIGKPVINRGIPGDTTASALRRLNRDVLSGNPDMVLITLGGNDLKNGVARNSAFRNLELIVQAIQKQGSKVIIGGLKFPGIDRGFGAGYENLASQTGAALISNIFEGVAEDPNLMSDPIHPNNFGYRIIARRFHDAILSYEEKKKPPVKAAVPHSSQTMDITLKWDDVAGATSYNIYWSDRPGVTKQSGTKISNARNPHKITGMKIGKKYYFVVTAVNAAGESRESEEFSYTVGQ